MTRSVAALGLAKSRPASAGRSLSHVLLAAWLAVLIFPAAAAAQPARAGEADLADRLNHQQMAAVMPAAKAPAAPATGAAAPGDEIGVLFLRGDGGDPQQLRADSGAALVFIARRDGDGRAYRDGREIGLDPAVKESIAQIAAAQFGATQRGDIVISALPITAQVALRQYAPNGAAPHVVFAHVTSRADTARVSDQRAAKILALAASANSSRNMVALVKMAMQMFGLKSDACDNSQDARCDEPGVREAFAQIKREEAQQHAATGGRF